MQNNKFNYYILCVHRLCTIFSAPPSFLVFSFFLLLSTFTHAHMLRHFKWILYMRYVKCLKSKMARIGLRNFRLFIRTLEFIYSNLPTLYQNSLYIKFDVFCWLLFRVSLSYISIGDYSRFRLITP